MKIKKVNKNRAKLKKGITLIELLIYVALLTIILGIITNFLYQVATFKVNNQVSSDLLQNSVLMINKMTRDIKEADEIIKPFDDNFSNELQVEIDEETITYTIEDEILKRNGTGLTDEKVRVFLDTNQGFRRIGNSIQIVFSLESELKPFGQNKKVKQYQTSAFFELE
ncbi:hypothetical protein COT75_04090 [Candidatus Beckwithbacteria bacterium CG10_big_fil_rev_8_21_14_0_10_34_10]|uniref:Prepilin-type N-terminal cleavage/methylation domain-containing protein n=1 Tax=Candidatus Beckwithbacteria bacterium CG10_big_fil_rev_8_21_14_0_10_34_10 TaxID=1974495 RepID=A0A2H0W8N3_9BACT|nr:MAG: hypothetical protein COT75_04090 [Candidatus Beckwithbacteria bacterium CG10_big_fil_rev_8_21_14_0_10_34_10]